MLVEVPIEVLLSNKNNRCVPFGRRTHVPCGLLLRALYFIENTTSLPQTLAMEQHES